MSECVTVIAECDQVFFRIIAGVAAKLLVVNFQVRHRAADLTSPAVAAKDLLPQISRTNRIQPQARGFGRIGLTMPSRSGLQEMPAVALRAET